MSDAVIVAIIAGLALVVQAIVTARTARKVSEVKHAVGEVAQQTTGIKDAVDHQNGGMPTLVQRVIDQDERGRSLARELAATTEWQQEAMRIMAREMGVTLPQPPPLAVRREEPELPKETPQ